jgi:outer membrane lipoprotein-sorting protein
MHQGTLFALVLIVGLGPHAAPAIGQASVPKEFDLSALMLRFGAVKQATARFTERKYLHILEAPLEDSGVLIFAAPGSLQKNTLQPNAERLMIDGDTLTIEREGKTETLDLADYPELGGFIEGIRATLAGNLATLERLYDPQLDGSIEAWRLVLKPRDEKMRQLIQSIRISGRDVHIERIETLERDGDHTDMTIVEDAP